MWLTNNGAVFDVLTSSIPVTSTSSSKVSSQQPVNPLCQQNSGSSNSKQPAKMLYAKGCPPPPTIDQHVAVHMILDGANANLQAAGQNELEGKSNYFIGKDSTKWHTKVPSFGSVSYSSVYPGIDLTYYGNQSGQLEYDFKVAPSADPNAITLNFEGADGVEIASNGDLILHIGKTEIHQPVPSIYQETNDSKGPKSKANISGGYVSKGVNRVGFKINGNYDHSKPLVIDPVLIYSTYLAGSGINGDVGYGIAVDASGNAYITGVTSNTNFPITAGAFQTTSGGSQDVFVTKLKADGSGLVYSSYLGGSDIDRGFGIVVDNNDNAYVTGYTYSANFPITSGAFQNTPYSNDNAFVTKLNTDGSNLIFSTYLGGSNYYQGGLGIAVDISNNVYVTGYTDSTDFPTTPGAFQITYKGSYTNAFVSKLNESGTALIYSTYLGGADSDESEGIAIDNNNNAYITGDTNSTNFPTTAGAFQTALSGYSDAFVTKLNANGSGLVYSTYLGGVSDDNGSGIAIDSSGNAYVTGFTGSNNFPTTPKAFQKTLSNVGNDTFISKLKPDGSGLIYSTYLGGSLGSVATGIVVDSNGNAYVTGATGSADFPITSGAFQTSLGSVGFDDAFITELNVGGDSLLYSTYVGGSDADTGYGIALDNKGFIYVAGLTRSSNFPVTPTAFQRVGQGNGYDNAFVLKFSPLISNNFGYHLQFDTQPVGNFAGMPFTTQPVVSVRDNNNQIVQSYTGTVTINILNILSDNATILGSSVVSVTNGIATFTNLSINKSGNYLLTATANNTTWAITDNLVNIQNNPQTSILPGIPDFSGWDADDLFTAAAITQSNTSNAATDLNFSMGRYYGLVNPNTNKLIDVDPDAVHVGFTSQQIQNNATLHDSVATLYLWVQGNTSSVQTLAVNGHNYGNLQIAANVGASSLISVPIQLSDLMFPNICNGVYSNPQNWNCLRDPDKAVGPVLTDMNYADNFKGCEDSSLSYVPDGDPYACVDSLSSITSTLNTISLAPISGNTALTVQKAYLFLNGVRPVLMMAGIDLNLNPFDSHNSVRDTTSDWGAIDQTSDNDFAVDARNGNNWITWLSNLGVPNYNPPRNGTQSVDDQQQYIEQGYNVLQKAYGVRKVNILSHSMGGITSQVWTANNPNAVDSYTSFNSPHGGVTISGKINSAAADLDADKVSQFNSLYNLATSWGISNSIAKNRVFLTTTYGKHNTSLCLILNSFQCLADAQPASDDGLIDIKSGEGLAYSGSLVTTSNTGLLPSNYATINSSLCDYVQTGFAYLGVLDLTCHKASLTNTDEENWVKQNSNIFDYSKNTIPSLSYSTVFNGCGYSGTCYNVTHQNAIKPSASIANTPKTVKFSKDSSNQSQTVLNTSGQLSPNITLQIPVYLDGSDAGITIGMDSGFTGTVTLEDNNGNTLFSPQAVPSDIYLSSLPSNNSYNLLLNSNTLTTTVNYSIDVTTTSPMVLQPQVNINPSNSGKSSTVSVYFGTSTTPSPAQSTTVTATLTLADSNGQLTTTVLTLLDDGQTTNDGDSQAGDGYYTALLPSNLITQTGLLNIFALGSSGNTYSERFASINFKAKSGELNFTGPYSWETNTITNTTFVGTATFNVGVNVQQAGNFILSASLAAPDGTTVATGSATVSLNAGNNQVTIPFDMSSVWNSQLDGPYHISALTAKFVGTSVINNSDTLNDPSSLAQLNLTLSQLNHPLAMLNGAAISDTALNPDSNNNYQTLEVSVPVTVAVSNVYSYSAVLITQNGLPAGAVSGQVNLQAGSNTPLLLDFPGNTIYATGQNGPYLVQSLTIEDTSSGQVLLFDYSVGQTSAYQYTQFSNQPNVVSALRVNTNNLAFEFAKNTSSSTVATQTLQLAATTLINWTGEVKYAENAANWLNLDKTSGTLLSNNEEAITLSLNNKVVEQLPIGIYTATLLFRNNLSPNVSATVNITLTVVNSSYTYYLPSLANDTNGYTSYLAFQNVGSTAANFSIKYYDTNGSTISSPTLQGNCVTLPANAECLPTTPFNKGQSGSGEIISDQPLNVIVAEATPYGGSAYAVPSGSSNNLVAPLILKQAYGDFNTILNVFNNGSDSASVTVTFYDQNGAILPAASQTKEVAANTTWTLDQAISNLPAGFNGWAQISAHSGSQLVAQVLEQSQSRKFVAIANAQPSSKAASTLYAPAIFKGAFGFVTGVNIVNPNANPVSVTVTYYDDSGKSYAAPAFTLNANSITSIYQSSNGGNGLPTNPALPSGFSGAAIVASTGGGVLMVVNESGGVSAGGTSLSGVYAAANSGGGTVGLPVMANGGYGYTTGATILNTSSNTVNGTIQYYNTDGTKQGNSHSFTIGPNASQLVYQGDAAQGLSNSFYGTAIITETGGSQDLIVTTNAESGLFYTYTEPNN